MWNAVYQPALALLLLLLAFNGLGAIGSTPAPRSAHSPVCCCCVGEFLHTHTQVSVTHPLHPNIHSNSCGFRWRSLGGAQCACTHPCTHGLIPTHMLHTCTLACMRVQLCTHSLTHTSHSDLTYLIIQLGPQLILARPVLQRRRTARQGCQVTCRQLHQHRPQQLRRQR